MTKIKLSEEEQTEVACIFTKVLSLITYGYHIPVVFNKKGLLSEKSWPMHRWALHTTNDNIDRKCSQVQYQFPSGKIVSAMVNICVLDDMFATLMGLIHELGHIISSFKEPEVFHNIWTICDYQAIETLGAKYYIKWIQDNVRADIAYKMFLHINEEANEYKHDATSKEYHESWQMVEKALNNINIENTYDI